MVLFVIAKKGFDRSFLLQELASCIGTAPDGLLSTFKLCSTSEPFIDEELQRISIEDPTLFNQLEKVSIKLTIN